MNHMCDIPQYAATKVDPDSQKPIIVKLLKKDLNAPFNPASLS